MVNSLYGYKDKQTQGYTPDGMRVPLTWIRIQPNVVTGVRNHTNSLQVALGKKKNLSKPLQGILNKITDKFTPKHFREIKNEGLVASSEGKENSYNVGTKIVVSDVFNSGDKIKITGTSKGKGFQGVIRRHGFKGGKATHGASTKTRHPGSIGQTTTPGRVYKGKRMAGHMGSDTVTIKGLEVFEVKPEEGFLVVKGLIPGGKNGLVRVTKQV